MRGARCLRITRPTNHLLHALERAGAGVAAGVIAVVILALPTAPRAAAGPGAVQAFTITFDLAAPDEPGVVDADGPISGRGFVFASERDTGNAFHETETFVFPNGTLAVSANGVGTSSEFQPFTCTESFVFKGTFSITGGTGDFAAARGHGHFDGHSSIVFALDPASPDGCDFDPVSGSIDGEALGRVSL